LKLEALLPGSHDAALVCESGHVINESFQDYPEFNTKHCKECGAKTIAACPACSTPIRGHYRDSNVITFRRMPAPAFCHECGAPYPWTKSALEAAEELVRLNDQLNEEEKEALVTAVKDATRDTPKGKVAVEKIKRYGTKLGTEAFKTLREILTDIASEYTKKTLGL
jgi:hypothetical protein